MALVANIQCLSVYTACIRIYSMDPYIWHGSVYTMQDPYIWCRSVYMVQICIYGTDPYIWCGSVFMVRIHIYSMDPYIQHGSVYTAQGVNEPPGETFTT